VSRTIKIVIGAVVGLAVLVSAGTFVFIHFIEGDAPKRLSLSTTGTTAAPSNEPLDGTWRPTSASQVGYRVKEVLFGQDHDAVGRTNKVSGTMVMAGTTVTGVDLTVDMASVTSDQSRRDNQFRGRIMDVSSFLTATFKLTKPIALASSAGTVTVPATGDLTLRGTTRSVTVDLHTRRNGSNIEVNGTIPITFDEWGIPSPSFGPVTTQDHGELELLVVFAKAA